MIYLKQTSDMQRFLIPKGREVHADAVSFKLSNLIYANTLNVTLQYLNALYNEVLIKLPQDIQPGEYEYSFYDDIGEISSGVFEITADKDISSEYLLAHEFEEYVSEYQSVQHIVTHEYEQHEVEHEFEEYWWNHDLFIDVEPDVIWLYPDEYITDVFVRSNVEWEII